MEPRSNSRRSLWAWRAAVGVTHAIVFGFTAYRAEFHRSEILGPSLYRAHTIFTGFVFHDWWRPFTPGYLWQVTARVLTEASGTGDLRVGATIATSLFYGIFGVAIFEVFRRSVWNAPRIPSAWAFAASLVIAMLESPAAFAGWRAFVSGRIFLPLYLSYAPTTVGSLGLNVFLLLWVADLVDGRLSPRRQRWLPALVALAAVAKPTMVPVTVVVVLGYALVATISRRSSLGLGTGPDAPPGWIAVVRLVVLPAAAILIPQFVVTATKVQYPGTGYDDRGAWILHPLAELRDLNGLSPLFWVVLAFPLVALIFARRWTWTDTAVRFALLAAAIGIIASVLFERSGSHWKGDLLQLPQAAIALVLVFLPKRLIDGCRSGNINARTVAGLTIAFVPYVLAGTLSWTCRAGIACPLG